MNDPLAAVLLIAAVLQLIIAVLNLNLARMLHWKSDIARMPLLLREVFHVHSWFVSVTLIIFAVMTARFAAAMADGSSEPLRWLAGAIGAFWTLRTILQVTYYDHSHWIGKRGRTAIHLLLLLLYGGMAAVYLVAAA